MSPPSEFRDRLAQASTIAKGFIWALRGSARKMVSGERRRLIIDTMMTSPSPRRHAPLLTSLAPVIIGESISAVIRSLHLGRKSALSGSASAPFSRQVQALEAGQSWAN